MVNPWSGYPKSVLAWISHAGPKDDPLALGPPLEPSPRATPLGNPQVTTAADTLEQPLGCHLTIPLL